LTLARVCLTLARVCLALARVCLALVDVCLTLALDRGLREVHRVHLVARSGFGLFRSKVDRFVPQNQNVNIRIVSQPDWGRAGMWDGGL